MTINPQSSCEEPPYLAETEASIPKRALTRPTADLTSLGGNAILPNE